MFGNDTFRFTRTVVPVSLNSGGDTFTGRFLLHRGDRVRGVRICLAATRTAFVNMFPFDLDFELVALNDSTAALGEGISLPATRQLDIVELIQLPYTTSAAMATTTTPATGVVAQSNVIQSVDIILPLDLLCDSSTRDIAFSVSAQNLQHDGFVSLDFEPAPDQYQFPVAK